MHNLEQSITQWRRTMMTAPNVSPETLDELENHLRETVEELVGSGMSRTDAFQQAVSLLGTPEMIATEFEKLAPPAWLPAKAAKALLVTIGLLTAFTLIPQLRTQGGVWDPLLAAHALTVTLGYMTALLLGVMGICFVCQRCWADFPARRLHAMRRDSVALALFATGLIATGVVLGMLWSSREWGRVWGWDPKEIGALAILLWLGGLLVAHTFRKISPRAFLVSSVLGGNIAALAYFGPALLAKSYAMASPLSVALLVFEMLSLLMFLLAFAPAGWLRFRNS
jgi:hypothetical protein